MGTKGRGLYIAGALGLGALLGAGCVGGVKVDPAEPVKDESFMYGVDGKDNAYLKGLSEIEGPVKGIKGIEDSIEGPAKDLKGTMKGLKGIESYITSPEETSPRWWCMWYCYYPPRTP